MARSVLDELWLEWLAGPELPQRRLPLTAKLSLGRHPENDLVLPDPAVSRHHLRIENQSGLPQVIDLGSRVGSALNDHPLPSLTPVPLREHDRLRVGPWRFRVIGPQGYAQPRSFAFSPSVSLSGATQTMAPALVAERRLELLVEFAAAVAIVDSQVALAACVADFAVRGCNARSASVLSLQGEGLSPLALHPEGADSPQPDGSVAQAALAGGVVQLELGDGGLGLAVSLRLDQLPWGLLWIVLDPAQRRSRSEACEFAHALARLAGLTLGSLERREVALRIERLQSDLEQAREVQRRVLPPSRGEYGRLHYALHVHPGRQVAGDLADVFRVADGRVAIVLGDVAGAGVGAGFMMAGVQAYLHAELMETGDASVAATRCNHYLARVGGGRFVTAWIGVIDIDTGHCQYVDAGHGHVRLVRDGQALSLPCRGSVPLGIGSDSAFESEALQLSPALRVVLYSDGVAEQRSAEGQVFVDAALAAVLQNASCPAEDVEKVMAGLSLYAGGQ
ncbi:MAG: SpoIIE family protein phosphatase, partial [Xanthomonadales bacterium]|nr:SpoIIE family protein phosphatase [Xanthomonadales bacterium]